MAGGKRTRAQVQLGADRRPHALRKGHDRPSAVLRPGQRRAAENHRSQRAEVEFVERQRAGEVRPPVLDLHVDVAGDGLLIDRTVEPGQHQQAVAVIGVGRQRQRRAGAHARQRHAHGHQPRLDIARVEAELASGRRPLPRLGHRAVEGEARIGAGKAEFRGKTAGQRALGREVGGRLAQQAERQRGQAVERQKRGGVRVLRVEGHGQLRLFGSGRPAVPRQRGREGRAAGAALRGKRQPGGAVAIVGGTRHQVDARIRQKVGIGFRPCREPLQHGIVRIAAGRRPDQRGKVDGDHGGVEIAGRARREILDAAGGADRGAGQPAHRQPVYLQRALPQPQRRIQRIGRQAPGFDRPGLDLEIEVAVGEAVGALVGHEDRGEGRQSLHVERAAVQRHRHRGPCAGRLGGVDAAGELGLAEDQFQVAEALPVVAHLHVGLEAGGRKAADRLVHVAGQPCREARGLADRQQQRAGKAEAVLRAQQPVRLQRGAPGQRGGERFHLPAALGRLGREMHVADRGVAGHHSRQPHLHRARHGRPGQRGQRLLQ